MSYIYLYGNREVPNEHWLYDTTRPAEADRDHSFGGPPKHSGVIPTGGSHPIQLLYNFDMRDSRFQYLPIPYRWLPLYHAFQYQPSSLWYKVTSDTTIEIADLKFENWHPNFPYENYPAEFETAQIKVDEAEPVDLFLTDPDDDPQFAEDWLDHARAIESCGETVDHHDLIAFRAHLPQGAMKTQCINPGCNGHVLDLIARIGSSSPAQLWGKFDEDEVAVCYEICKLCGILFTYNVCT